MNRERPTGSLADFLERKIDTNPLCDKRGIIACTGRKEFFRANGQVPIGDRGGMPVLKKEQIPVRR